MILKQEVLIKKVIMENNNLYTEYEVAFSDEINTLWDEVEGLSLSFLNYKHTFNFSDNDDFYLRKIESTFLKYFKHANGYIGRDIYILNDSLYKSKIYHKILMDEYSIINELNLTNNFYIVLMCIYNIKDKLLGFIGAHKPKGNREIIFDNPENLSESKTVLNNRGKEQISALFKRNYPKISKYINARNILVHNNCALSYSCDNHSITISNFGFNLNNSSNNKTYESFEFSLDENKLKKIIKTIYELREQFCIITYNKENINMELYENTFMKEDGSRAVPF